MQEEHGHLDTDALVAQDETTLVTAHDDETHGGDLEIMVLHTHTRGCTHARI